MIKRRAKKTVADETAAKESRQRNGDGRRAWRRFSSHRMAFVGGVIVAVFAVTALIAPWIAPYDPIAIDLSIARRGPNAAHWLGTDSLGRDILSRIIVGSRYTLGLTFLGVAVGALIGGSLGCIAGFFGGGLDNAIMRLMDLLLAFPGILLTIVIVTIMGTGMQGVVIAIGIYTIPELSRILRASVLSVREMDFIEAARAVGCGNLRILFGHVVTNAFAPSLVYTTLRLARAILITASLSFLGMGAKPPTPEWGAMLSTGRSYIRSAPHITVFPGLAIMLVVMGFNLLGDGLRDFLDPRLKKTGE
jgi:peptide/nickel transport system permease protein